LIFRHSAVHSFAGSSSPIRVLGVPDPKVNCPRLVLKAGNSEPLDTA